MQIAKTAATWAAGPEIPVFSSLANRSHGSRNATSRPEARMTAAAAPRRAILRKLGPSEQQGRRGARQRRRRARRRSRRRTCASSRRSAVRTHGVGPNVVDGDSDREIRRDQGAPPERESSYEAWASIGRSREPDEKERRERRRGSHSRLPPVQRVRSSEEVEERVHGFHAGSRTPKDRVRAAATAGRGRRAGEPRRGTAREPARAAAPRESTEPRPHATPSPAMSGV